MGYLLVYPGHQKVVVMNKLFFVIVILIFNTEITNACTAFICDNKVVHVFDFSSDMVRVVYTPVGEKRSSLSFKPLSWVARFASFTFTQFYYDLPQSGMNAEGLAVVGLMQNDAKFPALQSEKWSLNELQFIQYVLDSFATVDQVLKNVFESIQISSVAVGMHYLLYDRSGDRAIIEFVNGDLVITRENDLRVLTNNNYQSCKSYLKTTDCLEEMNPEVDQARFSLVGHAIDAGDNIDGIFSRIRIPAKDTLTEWCQGVEFHTRWKVVFDPYERQIDFAFANQDHRAQYRFDDKEPPTGGACISNPEEEKPNFRQGNLSDGLAQVRAKLAVIGQCGIRR